VTCDATGSRYGLRGLTVRQVRELRLEPSQASVERAVESIIRDFATARLISLAVTRQSQPEYPPDQPLAVRSGFKPQLHIFLGNYELLW